MRHRDPSGIQSSDEDEDDEEKADRDSFLQDAGAIELAIKRTLGLLD
jgi:hypothetical protein